MSLYFLCFFLLIFSKYLEILSVLLKAQRTVGKHEGCSSTKLHTSQSTSQHHHPAIGGQCIQEVAQNVGECGDQEQVPGWYVVEEEPTTHSRYCIAAKQHNIGEGVEGFTLFQAWFNVLEEEELSEGSIMFVERWCCVHA